MSEVGFGNSLVSYKLNDAVEVVFNPTDPAFVERLLKTIEGLDKKQSEIRKADGKRDAFDIVRKCEAEMRGMIDEVLGQNVCEALFGEKRVCALSGGLPLWRNLMLALVDEIDAACTREQKAVDLRIQKYIGRNKKYRSGVRRSRGLPRRRASKWRF